MTTFFTENGLLKKNVCFMPERMDQEEDIAERVSKRRDKSLIITWGWRGSGWR